MTRRHLAVVLVLVLLGSGAGYGQRPSRIRTSVVYEAYKFDPGLVFNQVTELMIPIQVDIPLGRFAALALSTGYVSVGLESAVDENLLGDQSLSGMLDTQARFSVRMAQGRLVCAIVQP